MNKNPKKPKDKKKEDPKKDEVKKKGEEKNPEEEKFDIEQVLLKSREVFLAGLVESTLITETIKKLMALDKVSDDPIILWINSPGGSVQDGFALIDTMEGIGSPVITIINGKACSMAGLISIAGHKRYITRNSLWMAHDMSSGVIDYASKAIARVSFWKRTQSMLKTYLKKNTKLTKGDIDLAFKEELWMYAEECKAKGIVDEILGDESPKKKSKKKVNKKKVAKSSKKRKK